MATRKKGKISAIAVGDSERPTYLKRYGFNLLKKNPDFIFFVKMGRVYNGLSFGLQCIEDSLRNIDNSVGRRHFFRSLMISGGYLFETLELLGNNRLKYPGEQTFLDLLEFTKDSTWKIEKHILKEIRNSVAFHLDKWDKTTEVALANLNLKRYRLMEGERLIEFHFILADEVDLNYLIDTLKQYFPGKTEDEVHKEIFAAIPNLLRAITGPLLAFTVMLSNKLKLRNYIEP